MNHVEGDWQRITLGEALEMIIDHRGKTPGKLGGVFVDEGVPVISALHIKGGKVDFSLRERFVTPEMFKRWMPDRLRRGDVLLTSEAPLGSVAFVPSDSPLVLSQRLFALRGKAGLLDNRFLRWALESPQVRSQLNRRSSGTTVTGIRQSELRRIELVIPPVDEQRRIVDILEDHLSIIDAVLRSCTLAILRLDTLRKGVLATLIPDETKYPITWKHSTVAEAGTVELGRQRHPDWHNGSNMKPYLRVANVFEDRIDVRDVKAMHWPDGTFEKFKLHEGDILLNEGQSPEFLGRPAIYRGEPPEVAFTNSLLRFRAGSNVIPEFALLVFRRHMHVGRFRRESRITTNIAHLSASRLKPVEFPIPPIEEQVEIVRVAADRLSTIERVRVSIESIESRTTTLRRSVLTEAFSGRLTERAIDDRFEEFAGV